MHAPARPDIASVLRVIPNIFMFFIFSSGLVRSLAQNCVCVCRLFWKETEKPLCLRVHGLTKWRAGPRFRSGVIGIRVIIVLLLLHLPTLSSCLIRVDFLFLAITIMLDDDDLNIVFVFVDGATILFINMYINIMLSS